VNELNNYHTTLLEVNICYRHKECDDATKIRETGGHDVARTFLKNSTHTENKQKNGEDLT
jgi:hypothetical protein